MTNTYAGNPSKSGKSKHAKEFAGLTDEILFDAVVEEGQDPDNYINGVRYEFSVAPAEQEEYSMIGERHKSVYDSWRIHLATMLGGVALVELITECSTPKHGRYTPGQLNRIHFHGYITFTDYAEFIMERAHLLSKVCTFKISNLREQIWATYIAKQRYLMEPKLGKLYRLLLGITPVVSSSEGQGPPAKGVKRSAKSSVRRAGVYNPEAVIAFN